MLYAQCTQIVIRNALHSTHPNSDNALHLTHTNGNKEYIQCTELMIKNLLHSVRTESDKEHFTLNTHKY